MNGNQLPLGEYLRRAWGYRWVILVPAVVAFAAATAFITVQPDVYESQVVFMSPLVKASGAVTGEMTEASARDVVRSAREYLLGTKFLTTVMDQVDPYPQLRRTDGDQAVMERLRRNLAIEFNSGTGALTLGFRYSEGSQPAQMSADVPNRLADLFIEKQLVDMREAATSDKVFLEREEADYRTKLETAERALDSFRHEHQGELPDDIVTNQNLIFRYESTIRDLVQRQQTDRNEIERYKMAEVQLQQQLRVGGGALAARGGDGVAELVRKQLSELEQQRIKDLRNYDSESEHIARLEEEIAGCRTRLEQLLQEQGSDSTEDTLRFLMELNGRRQKELEQDIVRCDDMSAQAKAKMEQLDEKNRMAESFRSQYNALERNVSDASRRRDQTIQRLQVALNIVRRQEFDPATPVQIEQRAMPPAKPAGPDRLATALVGLVLGVGVGVGLVILRRKLDVSYHEMSDLRALLPGTALVTVPEVSQLTRRLPRMLLGAFCGLILLAVFVGTLGLLGLQVGWIEDPRMLEAVRSLR